MSVPTANPTTGAEVPRLRRVLTLWDLIFYGIVAVTPSAPATVYGLAEVKSGGYVVVTILAAMVAMVLTAISYGRMAALYPSAGSAYAYVSRGIHPYLGFVAGWAMLLDYMLIPLFCTLYGTLSLQRALPMLPFPIGALFFAGGITLLKSPRDPIDSARQSSAAGFYGHCAAEFHRAGDSLHSYSPRLSGIVFYPAVLSARHLSCPRHRLGHFVRGADLSRLRRRHDHGRGCEESAQERLARSRFSLSVHWFLRWTAGVSRPSSLAQLQHLHQY